MSSTEKKLEQAAQDIEELENKLTDVYNERVSSPLGAIANGAKAMKVNLQSRRLLKGHFGKVCCLSWGPDSRHLVTAAQDGHLIVWDALYASKQFAFNLVSSWVLACAYSPSGSHVASGGLDNIVSVYRVPEAVSEDMASVKVKPVELSVHEGYLSSIEYIDDSKLVSSSGDGTCTHWDVSRRQVIGSLFGHESDVMTVSVAPDGNTVVTGACDATTRIWDLRTHKCVNVLPFHESDVNAVKWFPTGNAFLSASDDSSVRLTDIRASSQLMMYTSKNVVGFTSCDSSRTGRALFAGTPGGFVDVFDTLTGAHIDSLAGFDHNVSGVEVSPDGKALAASSWDTLTRLFA